VPELDEWVLCSPQSWLMGAVTVPCGMGQGGALKGISLYYHEELLSSQEIELPPVAEFSLFDSLLSCLDQSP
jgi:hypothetical protein